MSSAHPSYPPDRFDGVFWSRRCAMLHIHEPAVFGGLQSLEYIDVIDFSSAGLLTSRNVSDLHQMNPALLQSQLEVVDQVSFAQLQVVHIEIQLDTGMVDF